MKIVVCAGLFAGLVVSLNGCGTDSAPRPPVDGTQSSLENRAYIVARDSDDVTVIDLGRLEIVGRVKTGGVMSHMGDLNAELTKLYVDSTATSQAVVIDVTHFEVLGRIVVGEHPTHLTLTPSGLFAIMNEDEGTISFVDTERDVEVKRLGGFYTPHFMRMSPDGRSGYVANVGASHITRVNLDALEIEEQIPLDGMPVPTLVGYDSGFADAQIDRDGILYAAHGTSGRVLVYDTNTKTKLAEVPVGAKPWIVYAEHPFANVPLRHLVPNFGDQTVSMLTGNVPQVVATMPGDQEAFGVNYTSVAPNKAFVMNKIRQDIAVVDTERGVITTRINVGGNTETASTSADGKLIVAAVSGADKVVVIDAATNQIIKTFDNVGKYPWSVTIPRGQNYCH